MEKWFDEIASLDERDMMFGVQVDFIEGIYTRLYGEFLGILKTHIDHAPRIQDASCCRHP